MRRVASALLLVCCWLTPASLAAQVLEETPTLAGGRIAFGGEVTVTAAPDDRGDFNITDYNRSALQLVRLGLTASIRPFERVTLVSELRAEGDTSGGPWSAIASALYVRVRPWRSRPFDV